MGRLVVSRLDTVARIVSGTFEFTARRGANMVQVREGRFDSTFWAWFRPAVRRCPPGQIPAGSPLARNG